MLLLLLRLHAYLFVPPARVLDIAPARSVRNFLQPLLGDRYVATDLFPMAGISLRSDLTGLAFPDASFDVIICYHVLEHIPNDQAAMRELVRVLKPGGMAFIQVPRRPGSPTDEDPSAPVEERIRRFGQDDHVRMYGVDLEDRLRRAGLSPMTVTPAARWPAGQIRQLGLAPSEEIWICRPGGNEPVLQVPPDAYWLPRGPIWLQPERGIKLSLRRALGRNAAGRVALRMLRAVRRGFRSVRS